MIRIETKSVIAAIVVGAVTVPALAQSNSAERRAEYQDQARQRADAHRASAEEARARADDKSDNAYGASAAQRAAYRDNADRRAQGHDAAAERARAKKEPK